MVISSAIGFGIFFWVLLKFLWKPTLKVIDERRDSIEQAFQEVDDARADVERLKREYEDHLRRINDEAQDKLNEAVEKGRELAGQIREDAENQREKLLEKTREDIEREKERALADLRNQAIDLSFTLGRRVIQEGLDRETHDKLVERFISDIKELN
jgi:F-type H+-transporting ATPase subunit b